MSGWDGFGGRFEKESHSICLDANRAKVLDVNGIDGVNGETFCHHHIPRHLFCLPCDERSTNLNSDIEIYTVTHRAHHSSQECSHNSNKQLHITHSQRLIPGKYYTVIYDYAVIEYNKIYKDLHFYAKIYNKYLK